MKKNGGDLTDAINEWNDRGAKINTPTGLDYSGFLDTYFNSAYTKDLKLVKRIQLAKVLGLIGFKDDFLLFDRYFPRLLPLTTLNSIATKITRYI